MEKNKNKIIISTFITLITLIIMVLSLAKPYRISGDCMEPAIMDGHLYFLNRISPYLRKYQIGDIILFKHEEIVWISRIVALETNTIQIADGSIVVNDVALQDDEIQRNWTSWRYGTYGVYKPIQIPAGHVYVLSDNLSAHHDDSRVFGPISKKSILGIIW